MASKYLTPYQELIESTNLGQRAFEESVRANPLAQRDAAVLAGAPPEVPATSAVVPNPLNPPVPLSVMPTDQRIAWQKLEDDRRAQQAALEKTMLDTEVTRTERELKDEERRQSIAMIAEVPKLKEAVSKGDLDKYFDLKADLVSRYPVGSGSLEAQRAFKTFDDVVNRKTSVEDDVKKAATARSEAARQKRLEAGYKEAGNYGADVLREYAAMVDKDPVNGPVDANKYLAGVQQRNLVLSLRDTGLNEQEITQRYGGGDTGRPFDYQAAKQAPKSRAAVAAERNKARQDWAILDKAREVSGFNPAGEAGTDPYAASNGWTPEKEQLYKETFEYWQSLTPQIGENRAGVVGMGVRGPASQAGSQPAVVTKPPAVRERIKYNPATGEKIVLRNGKWEPI